MEINKLGSPYNWQYIDTDKLPQIYNKSDIKEDFDLLFNDQIDRLKLKEILRNSIREPNQSVRKYLWKRILFNDHSNTHQYSSTTLKYEEKLNKMFGKNLHIKADLPSFVDKSHLLYYYLNDTGKLAVKRVLCILQSVHPEITYSPLLLPLVSLFLHYMSESESYAAILAVVESGNKITETDIHWNTTCQVYRCLAKKYSSTSYKYVLQGTYKSVNCWNKSAQVIDDWYWWIFEYLPFNYILNIIDTYLLEGQKVLYRYGIVILDHFVRSFVRKPAHLDLNCFKSFCSQIPIQIERLNKSAFSIRNMKRKEMQVLFDVEEENIKRLREEAVTNDLIANRSGDDVHATRMTRSGSTISNKKIMWRNPFKNLKSYRGGSGKKWERQVLSYRNHNHGSQNQKLANLPAFSVETIGSKILVPEEIVQIWRWLPTRWQILELETVYSTDIHGCRLMTLFDKTEYYQATIIIVKTVVGSVFGAFCSQPWSNRFSRNSATTYKFAKPSFFGTGETFLFQLRPTFVKYEWVGKHIQGETDATQELFLYADNKTLVVGSGGEGNGLAIDENLQFGSTVKCNTFANEPLCSEGNFEIEVLEVFSFKSSNG
jgi:hypothetical protein